MPSMKSTLPEIAENGALALIAVAVSLLDRQIKPMHPPETLALRMKKRSRH